MIIKRGRERKIIVQRFSLKRESFPCPMRLLAVHESKSAKAVRFLLLMCWSRGFSLITLTCRIVVAHGDMETLRIHVRHKALWHGQPHAERRYHKRGTQPKRQEAAGVYHKRPLATGTQAVNLLDPYGEAG
jgi:hypothetical protein